MILSKDFLLALADFPDLKFHDKINIELLESFDNFPLAMENMKQQISP